MTATLIRNEYTNQGTFGIDSIADTLGGIKKDVDGLKIKIALWSGGISVGVSMVSVFLKGFGK